MSHAATNATYPLLASMGDRLQVLPAKRRPSHLAAVAVMLLLADKYRDSRGYVNESVEQIAMTLGISESMARTVLSALDSLGLWKRVGSGNRHAPAKRIPTFLEDGADPTPCEGEERGAGPTAKDGLERGVEHGVADLERGVEALERGADPTTPRSNPVNNPVSLTDDDERLIHDHLEAHIAFKAGKVDPHKIRRSQPREMAEKVLTAKRLGWDLADELEKTWETRPHEGQSFDLADYARPRVPAPDWLVNDATEGAPVARPREVSA